MRKAGEMWLPVQSYTLSALLQLQRAPRLAEVCQRVGEMGGPAFIVIIYIAGGLLMRMATLLKRPNSNGNFSSPGNNAFATPASVASQHSLEDEETLLLDPQVWDGNLPWPAWDFTVLSLTSHRGAW